MADRALVETASLYTSLGRVEDLAELIHPHRYRILVEPGLAQVWRRAIEAYFEMVKTPGKSYRCGTFALENASLALTGERLAELRGISSSINGFTLAELTRIAERFGLEFVPAVRSESAAFVYPAVIHWKQNHYAAIAKTDGERFLVEDPTFRTRIWMEADVLEEEASGFFLIPASVELPKGWRYATPEETEQVYGKGYPNLHEDNDPQSCKDACCEGGPGPSGTGSEEDPCAGMPTWEVQEPQINLIVSDLPMVYKAAFGPDFVLNLKWRQRFTAPSGLSSFNDLGGWGSDLLSYVSYGEPDAGLIEATMELMWGDGVIYNLLFDANSTVSRQDYVTGMWAVRSLVNNSVTTLDVYFKNGAVDRYAQVYETGGTYTLQWRQDATGKRMTFAYDDPTNENRPTRLTTVTMADGAQFAFQYNYSGHVWSDIYRVSGVTGPNGRSVSFGYKVIDNTAVLSSITDAAGITSTFDYDPVSWWVTSFTTPYGTTSFALRDNSFCDAQHPLSCPGIDRWIVITEPGGTHQAYAFYDNPYDYTAMGPRTNEMAGLIPTAFSSAQIPTYAPDDPPVQTLDTARDKRNSHYWGRQQAALLSTLNLRGLTAADYRLSRTRHWLVKIHDWRPGMRTLAWELPPSPDGVDEVQPIFYDYPGKRPGSTNWWLEGTSSFPAVVSQQMPDGTTHYRYIERNALGMRTSEVERWVDGGSVRYRTNSFKYASGTGNSAVDNLLIVERKENGNLVFGRALHPRYPDQIRYETNAVGEITTFDYDANRRLMTRQTHAGLLSTYTYSGTDHRLQKVVDSIGGTPLRTNSYTWLNGYLRTHTDPRGFQRTFSFDFLGRITQVSYPDTTTETFSYVLPGTGKTGFNTSGVNLPILDLVTYKDRMGNYSVTLPNRNRQIETIVEPSMTTPGSFGTEHTIEWCGCGSPSVIARGSNTGAPEVTYLDYNYQGSLARVTLPNQTSITNRYDVLGRLAVQEDALMKVTNIFDNLSRIVERRNAAGLVMKSVFDNEDQVTSATDTSGVVTTNLYDALGRLLVRGYPNGGKEMWSYTPGFAEAARYTNQIGNVTVWGYDAAQRRLSEVGVGVYTNSFVYTPADDVRELWDGKNQKTTWGYDVEGRMQHKWDQSNLLVLTNGYNANGELTARWTAAKGLTAFTYDRLGNLTFVNYPVSPDITYQYDALSRLTNMVDAAGTSKFTYNTAGDLLTEEAPWANSKLTYGYHANVPHMVASASLQQPSGTWAHTYNYDNARRLQSVVSPAGTFTYTYSTGVGGVNTASLLVRKLALFSTTSAYITNTFDSSGRLTETLLRNSGNVNLNRHAYGYNNANQRTSQTRFDGTTVNYGYDTIGQLRSATGSEQLGYRYDAAFNLNARTNSGAVTSFGVNVRNELTTQPNGTATYDANGNLTADGVRTFSYDDENQLISVGDGTSSTEFVYDGMGRLRVRREFSGSGGGSTGGGTGGTTGGGTSQALISSQTLSPTLRNDINGWVGLRLVVGSTNLIVTELGRWVVSGNSGTHTVRLATSSGAQVAAVTVNTSGQPAGGYVYGTLSSPVTLTANATYYLVSQESSGGDQWYEWNTTVTTSGGATVAGAAYNLGSGYVNATPGTYSYGPVNLKFATGGGTGGSTGGSTGGGSGAEELVTGVSLGTLRNNHAGWVGFKFTVGSSALTVGELGRWVVSGNSGSHAVKIVTATGAAVTGASVTVNTAGATAGQFKYVALASPVTLAANTTYSLVSQEASGGDQWYDVDTTLTTSGAAAINNAVWSYNNSSSFYNSGSTGQSYGPVSLRTVGSGPSTQTLVTGVTLSGLLRNDVNGWLGFRMTVGADPITVTELGRWVWSGNSGSHAIKLVTGGGTDISGGSVTVNTSGKPVGAFTYATLATPVTLSANTAYYVMCYESSGGDYWGDWDNAVATTSAATISSSVYNVGGGYGNVGTGSFTYGPISLRYETGSGSGGTTPTGETRYLYMGRLVVQERDGNNTPTVSYTRGWDLSGSFEGAGGIGGLLARSHGYSGGSWSSHNAYHADGNGNITALVDTAQNVSASYRYDPYGNLLSSSGTMADANLYRFSSKEFVETGEIYYYGFRFYDPGFQRWLNQDPLGEIGGINLFRFVQNSPILAIDAFGLAPNQEGTCDPSHVADFLRRNPDLQELSDQHGGNENRYFYTGEFGWVDIRHFGRAAALVNAGWWGWPVETLGIGLEGWQWIGEWGDDYRSGFSPEDLPSNSAGIDFAKSIRPGETLSEAFKRWARESGARNDETREAGRNQLPRMDPAIRGGRGRGSSNLSSEPKRAPSASVNCVSGS